MELQLYNWWPRGHVTLSFGSYHRSIACLVFLANLKRDVDTNLSSAMFSSAERSLGAEAPEIGCSLSLKKSKAKLNEGGQSNSSSVKSLIELDATNGDHPSTSSSSNAVNLRQVESGLETYLETLEAIHWENSSSSVASVLGQMLTTVNSLSSSLEAQLDSSSPEHINLQQEIQSELDQIGELFSEYAERHPSMCTDQAEAAAVFEQLQAATTLRKQQSSAPDNKHGRNPSKKHHSGPLNISDK